jgi:hypothetical protein
MLPLTQISLSEVNQEIGRAPNLQISLDDESVRRLARVRTGTVSMNDLRGKFNPELGLSLTQTFAQGNISASNRNAGQNAVFACDIRFPNPITAACLLWEAGATGTGSWVGIGSSGFKVRAGDGSLNAPTTSSNFSAVLNITSGYGGDDFIHTVVWDIRINPGRVRLWIDGLFLGEANTSNNTVLSGGGGSSIWAGGNDDTFLSASSSGVMNGESASAWTRANPGATLRYYQNQLVSNTI